MNVCVAGVTGALATQLTAGEAPVLRMTEIRGASNAEAKREVGWQPRWSTWRVGFAKGLDQ